MLSKGDVGVEQNAEEAEFFKNRYREIKKVELVLTVRERPPSQSSSLPQLTVEVLMQLCRQTDLSRWALGSLASKKAFNERLVKYSVYTSNLWTCFKCVLRLPDWLNRFWQIWQL